MNFMHEICMKFVIFDRTWKKLIRTRANSWRLFYKWPVLYINAKMKTWNSEFSFSSLIPHVKGKFKVVSFKFRYGANNHNSKFTLVTYT